MSGSSATTEQSCPCPLPDRSGADGAAEGPRQMERLGRGVVATPGEDGSVLVS